MAIGTIVALLLAELALRVVGLPDTSRLFVSAQHFTPVEFVRDSECFWRLAPAHPEANAEGLRGPWWGDGAKAANEFRILAVGDSCTFGSGVAWEETWGVQLERSLQVAYPDRVVRVGLAALPGYTTFQNQRLLARLLPRARPDLVVFYCGAWNDFVPAVGANDDELARQLAFSRLLVLVRSLSLPPVDEIRAQFERGETPYGRRVPLAMFDALLTRMIEASRSSGAAVVTIAPSHPDSTIRKNPGLTEYRERVKALSVRLGVDCVDLASVVRQLDPTDAPPLPGNVSACFYDWVHPGANLHAALAREVAAKVAPAATAMPRQTTSNSRELSLRDGRVALPTDELVAVPYRAWLGDRPVTVMVERGETTIALPATMPPGTHVLEIVGPSGARDVGRVLVPAPPLRASRREAQIVFSGATEAGRLVMLWTASRRAEPPIATPFGEFGVDVPDLREPLAGVHRFDLAAANRHHTEAGADGAWSITLPVAANVGPTVFAQALVIDVATRRGQLTTVAAVDVR